MSKTQTVHINNTSNNAMVHFFGDIFGTEKIDTFLKSLPNSKENLVFENNSCVIIRVVNGNLEFSMIDHTPHERFKNRFISSDEFALLIEHLNETIPAPKGYKEGEMDLLWRHGIGFHNQTEVHRKDVLEKNPDLFEKYLELAKQRFEKDTDSKEDWSSQNQLQLAANEMCYDSPLTDEGIEEAKKASTKIIAFLDSQFLLWDCNLLASELYRTYQTAAIFCALFMKQKYPSSYNGTPVNAGYRELREKSRQVGSPFYPLGSLQRQIAESIDEAPYAYIYTILKNKPNMPLEEFAVQSDEFKKPFYDAVKMILAENRPRPLCQRPTELYGIPITHTGSGRSFTEVNLVNELVRMRKPTVVFVSGNGRKTKDFKEVYGERIKIDEKTNSDETQDLPKDVAAKKGKTIYEKLKQHCITEDTSYGPLGKPSELDSFIKWFVKREPLVQYMSKNYPNTEMFGYTSIVTYTDESQQIMFECTVGCSLRHVDELVGDLDPHSIPYLYTLTKYVNGLPEFIRAVTLVNPEKKTIGELHKVDPLNRAKFHPRYPALEELKLWMEENGIPW